MPFRDNIEKEVSGLYLTTIGRSPDSAGVAYWVDQVMIGNLTVAQVGQSFFDQPEVQAKYNGLSTTALVESVYQNVLGRDAEQAGLDYWAGQLDTGAFTKDRFIEAINNGATGDDASRLANLKDVGFYYMKEVGTKIDLASSVLASVTSDKATVTEALKLVEYYSQFSSSFPNTDLQTVNSWKSLSILDTYNISENAGGSSIDLWNTSGLFSTQTTNMYATYSTPTFIDDTVNNTDATTTDSGGLPPIPQVPLSSAFNDIDDYIIINQTIDFYIA
ncbi:MAG: hypothetical protein COB17_10635 [Sulfurimonas sp.]|nr:MAG: hypothetical protein COB17_10635 [Sulfurimonas sp.]